MVSMSELDLTVPLLWIVGVTLVLVARAVLSWLRFRYAAKSAFHARRLANATRPKVAGNGHHPDAAAAVRQSETLPRVQLDTRG